MPSKAQLKTYRSYRQKKFRDTDGVMVIEGAKLVEETLRSGRLNVLSVLGTEDFYRQHAALLDTTPFEVVGPKELSQLTNFRSAGPVWLLARRPELPVDVPAIRSGLTLYLDGVQDPGNVGTIWRTADWFGVQHLVASEQTADFWHPKTLQSSMGAYLRVPVERSGFAAFRARYPKLTVCGADMRGTDVFTTPLPRPALLVIGSEGQGLSAETIEALDLRVSIPRAANGGAESLNAAIATSILVACWQNIR